MSPCLGVLACVLGCASLAGCYRWEPVKISALPDLTHEEVGERQSRDSTGFRRARVERPDGTSFELNRHEFELTVTRDDGREFYFDYPVGVSRHGSDLVMSGGNRGETVIAGSRIRKAEVSQFDFGGTAVFCSLVGIALGALTYVVVK